MRLTASQLRTNGPEAKITAGEIRDLTAEGLKKLDGFNHLLGLIDDRLAQLAILDAPPTIVFITLPAEIVKRYRAVHQTKQSVETVWNLRVGIKARAMQRDGSVVLREPFREPQLAGHVRPIEIERLEVTRANLGKVPPHYVRKQTIANGERFITPELKEMEGKILGAEERSVKLEYELFLRVREAVIAQLPAIQRSASALAQLDVLAAFAETARLFNYCRPQMGEEGALQIREGRHPVLDQAVTEERFVPNDAELASNARSSAHSPPPRAGDGRSDGAHSTHRGPLTPPLSAGGGAEGAGKSGEGETGGVLPQIMLITGPNMAGKSTYIRQVALLALLAHTGSFIPAAAARIFVPARKARIGLVDRIFTRVGAEDDIASGKSTFMVEMEETATILHHATQHSLIILDEIGRGTSTYDGISIAWAVAEYLVTNSKTPPKTLFATHYHELTELAARLPRLRNYNVAVREWRDQVVFLRKIVPGSTDKSYGIQVARLAGVPKSVLARAKEILGNLEESELTPEGNVRQQARHRAEREKLQRLGPPPQLDLFG